MAYELSESDFVVLTAADVAMLNALATPGVIYVDFDPAAYVDD